MRCAANVMLKRSTITRAPLAQVRTPGRETQ
jgi:hypothetical protein